MLIRRKFLFDTPLKNSTIIVASLSTFLTAFMGSAINVALPEISKEFSMTADVMALIPTIYLLVTAILLVPFGRVADIYGRRKIMLYGMLIFMIGSALAGLSTNTDILIISRIIQGIGSSMLFGVGLAIVTSVFQPGERGSAIGINIASVYLGLSVGPTIGGLLTDTLGWRMIFNLSLIPCIIVIYIIIFKLKGEWAEAAGEKLDKTGSVLYGVAVALFMYGFSHLNTTLGIVLFICGTALLAAFVVYEVRNSNPVMNMRLFKNNTVFLFSNLAALINYSATFAVTFLLSLYLQMIKGFSARHAGLILVAQPIVMTIFSPAAGRLSDKVESRILASAGMLLTAAGLVLLLFLTEDSSITFIVSGLVFLGLGFGLFSSPNTNAIMSSVDKRYYSVSSAILSTMRLLGQMLSMGAAMFVLSIYVGNVKITPANHLQLMHSIRVLFGIFSVACILGVFASYARGKHFDNG
ncbi:MAG: drug resistance transporter, EmrB/QacA subfamily [Ignavibacteria bacterium]|nr:drug resistance transporter, EmrB/QacA subfamily [Ignavibacteria bacterium]